MKNKKWGKGEKDESMTKRRLRISDWRQSSEIPSLTQSVAVFLPGTNKVVPTPATPTRFPDVPVGLCQGTGSDGPDFVGVFKEMQC